MLKYLSTSLIVFGLLLAICSASLLWIRNDPNRLSFNLENLSILDINHSELSVPTLLVIGDISVQLPIFPARINGRKWDTTAEGVSYLSSTPLPGDPGNSVIYGHNWGSILGRLDALSPGDKIKILFSDGSAREFEVKYKQVVSPDDTSILNPTTDTRVTLYTCTGFLDQSRLVVTAKLITS
jgi:sortase A